jgi:Raf kinase inhibitor-like YbhB/YbcL family protein
MIPGGEEFLMRISNFLPVILLPLLFAFVLVSRLAASGQSLAVGKSGADMILTSPAFKNGEMIPDKFTCDGADISPALEWHSAPHNTKSFAIICDDPDAPVGTWVHWVYYDISPEMKGLPENVAPERLPSTGGKQGSNDFHRIGFGGPCPPGGTHRYYFKLYALDVMLNLAPGLTKKELLSEMKGHILEETYLMGKYKR